MTDEMVSGSTSATELEHGIFTLVITLVQTLVGQGLSRQKACAKVARLLKSYENALQKEFEEQEEE